MSETKTPTPRTDAAVKEAEQSMCDCGKCDMSPLITESELLERELEIAKQERANAIAEMFEVMDRDKSIKTLREVLHKQDSAVQELTNKLATVTRQRDEAVRLLIRCNNGHYVWDKVLRLNAEIEAEKAGNANG